MSEAELPAVSFSSSEPEDLAGYRPVSRAAVAALLLALLSIAALVSPLMLWAPLASLLLGGRALWSIRRSRGELVGRKLAVLALLVAGLFGAWGATRSIVRPQWVIAQARAHTWRWLQLVRAGELQSAHQLHLPQDDRVAPGSSLPQHYKSNSEQQTDFASFFDSHPLHEIVALGRRGELEFVANLSLRPEHSTQGRVEVILQEYRIDYEEQGAAKSLPFCVEIVRTYFSKTGEVRWHVRGVQPPPTTTG